jgi:cytosine permease
MSNNPSGLENEFEHSPVPLSHRHGTRSVAAVWFGFPMIITNAVFGGIMTWHLGFWQAIAAITLGNLVLFGYVGALSYIAGRSGLNFALQAKKTFGSRGYAVASCFLSTIVIGWYAFQTGLTGATLNGAFGWDTHWVIVLATLLYTLVTFFGVRALSIVGMIAAPLFVGLAALSLFFIGDKGSLAHLTSFQGQGGMSIGIAMTMVIAGFADSGTMTADFTRWSKDGRSAVWAAFSAFPVANLISLVFGVVIVSAGAALHPAESGGDFLPLLVGHGPLMNALAVLFVFVNLGSVCTHCLYNGAVGYSHLFGSRMRVMTVVLGVVGGLLALAGIWNLFLTWLSLLGLLVPPIGAVMIVDQLFSRREQDTGERYRASAFIAWAIGSLAAVLVHLWLPSLGEALVGLLVGGLAYAGLNREAVRAWRLA